MADHTLWHETLHDQFGQYFAVDNVLYHEKTDHQDLIIFENAAFGRVMALDGVVQTTERDEFIYHEMMTHVPLLAHGHAKHVLIIGGGDGAMLREVSRHRSIETITMVEIDAGVVSFCRQYLPNHNAGSYDDPRFNLVIDDGVNFVNQTTQTFDVIISDCTDPIGPGASLFTSSFYEGCKRCLNPGGIFVAQNGVCFLQHLYLILCYLTDYSYAKSWAWERLTPYKLLWYAELFADFSYLVFEKVAQWLYNAVKVDVLRHFHLIVVSFYCGSVALSAFDTVRVDSTLCEKAAVCLFSDLIPEYLIELCSDSLSLFLWICYAFELFKELLLTVYSYKSHIEKSCESFLNKVALVFSHKALIYEHAGELFAHCTADKSCGN